MLDRLQIYAFYIRFYSRTLREQGTQQIFIPKANLISENIELYEWEIRVQAYQSRDLIL